MEQEYSNSSIEESKSPQPDEPNFAYLNYMDQLRRYRSLLTKEEWSQCLASQVVSSPTMPLDDENSSASELSCSDDESKQSSTETNKSCGTNSILEGPEMDLNEDDELLLLADSESIVTQIDINQSICKASHQPVYNALTTSVVSNSSLDFDAICKANGKNMYKTAFNAEKHVPGAKLSSLSSQEFNVSAKKHVVIFSSDSQLAFVSEVKNGLVISLSGVKMSQIGQNLSDLPLARIYCNTFGTNELLNQLFDWEFPLQFLQRLIAQGSRVILTSVPYLNNHTDCDHHAVLKYNYWLNKECKAHNIAFIHVPYTCAGLRDKIHLSPSGTEQYLHYVTRSSLLKHLDLRFTYSHLRYDQKLVIKMQVTQAIRHGNKYGMLSTRGFYLNQLLARMTAQAQRLQNTVNVSQTVNNSSQKLSEKASYYAVSQPAISSRVSNINYAHGTTVPSYRANDQELTASISLINQTGLAEKHIDVVANEVLPTLAIPTKISQVIGKGKTSCEPLKSFRRPQPLLPNPVALYYNPIPRRKRPLLGIFYEKIAVSQVPPTALLSAEKTNIQMSAAAIATRKRRSETLDIQSDSRSPLLPDNYAAKRPLLGDDEIPVFYNHPYGTIISSVGTIRTVYARKSYNNIIGR